MRRGSIIIPSKFVSGLIVMVLFMLVLASLLKFGMFSAISLYNKTQVRSSIACDIAYSFAIWKGLVEYPTIFLEDNLRSIDKRKLDEELFDNLKIGFFNPRYDFKIKITTNKKKYEFYFPEISRIGFESCSEEGIKENTNSFLLLLKNIFFLKPFFDAITYVPNIKVLSSDKYYCNLPIFLKENLDYLPTPGRLEVIFFENPATILREGMFDVIVNNENFSIKYLGKYPKGCVNALFYGFPFYSSLGIFKDIGIGGCGFNWNFSKSEGIIKVYPSNWFESCELATKIPKYYYFNRSINFSEKVCKSKKVFPVRLIFDELPKLHFFLMFYKLRNKTDSDLDVCNKTCELFVDKDKLKYCKLGCNLSKNFKDAGGIVRAMESCANKGELEEETCFKECEEICRKNKKCEECLEEFIALSGAENKHANYTFITTCLEQTTPKGYEKVYTCRNYEEICKLGARYYYDALFVKPEEIDILYYAISEDKLKNRKIEDIKKKDFDWLIGSLCAKGGCSSSLECGEGKMCIGGNCKNITESEECKYYNGKDYPIVTEALCSPPYAIGIPKEWGLFTYQKIIDYPYPYASNTFEEKERCGCYPKIKVDRIVEEADCSKEGFNKEIPLWRVYIPKYTNFSLTIKIWPNTNHEKRYILNANKTEVIINDSLCREGFPKNQLGKAYLRVFFEIDKHKFSYILEDSIIKIK